MEFWVVLLFAIIAIVSDRMDSKKKPPPKKIPLPRQPRRTPIEIPELKNEPRRTDKIIYQEHETVNVEEQLRKQAEEARLREQELEKKRRILPPLNPVTMRDAIVLSEIIGKPKAYRRK